MQELKTLIEDVRAGDTGAYAEIVRRFQDMAAGYAYSLVDDFHLAEDAAQEAFLRAYLDLDQLAEPAAFPGWFRRIVFKQCDRLTRRKQVHAVALGADLEVGGSAPDPAARLESDAVKLELGHAIRRLPDELRAVTTLFYISQFTQKEIAAFLEVPASTVNNRLHAARKRLKKELMDMTTDNLQQQRPSKDAAFAGRVQEQIEAVAVLHGKLAPQLADFFSRQLGARTTVEIAAADHTLCVEVVQTVANACCIYTFQPRPGQERILVDVGMPLMAALVGRQLSAPLLADDLVQVQADEIDSLNEIMIDVLRALIKLWEGVIDIDIHQCELDTNPVALIANPKIKTCNPETPVFHVRFDIKWGDHSAPINVCYPADSMAAALEKLRA